MTKLSFNDFTDYDNKLAQYIKQEGIQHAFTQTKLEGVREMVKQLNMKKSTDVDQLAFLMWMLKDTFITLLNDEDFLLDYINLNYFEQIILGSTPALNIVGFAGCTPLGGPVGSSNQSLPHYDCIKFIGQYTNKQSAYDKCLQILEAMPSKLEGPIKDPPVIMYLMNYNQNANIDTSNNKFKTKPQGSHIDKLHDFNYSIYNPDPSHERQYNRYKVDLQRSFKQLTATNEIATLCLMNAMVHSHYHVIKNTESISRFYSKINDRPLEKSVEQLLVKISDMPTMKHEKEETKEEFMESIKSTINKKLRFLDKTDYTEMWSIAINAFVYVSDDEYEKQSNIIKRETLIELYEKQLIEPNCKFSHNLMREAVNHGRLWLVKFLISKGVPTQNLPQWGSWPWTLESQQLSDILLESVKDHSGFGTAWVNKRTQDKKYVYDYLLEHDYL